jgi:hypothetical protein
MRCGLAEADCRDGRRLSCDSPTGGALLRVALVVTQVEQFAPQILTNLRSAAAAFDVGDIAADVSTNSSSRCHTAANPLRWSRSQASSSRPGIGSDRAFNRQLFLLRGCVVRCLGIGGLVTAVASIAKTFCIRPVILIADRLALLARSNLGCGRGPPRCLGRSKMPVAVVVHRNFQSLRRTISDRSTMCARHRRCRVRPMSPPI